MPVVDFKGFSAMLDAANTGHYAYPAINISSIVTANAALAGLAAEESDGILQVSTGAGQFASGLEVKKATDGAIALAEYIHRAADHYDINIALHTDHCHPEKVDGFLRPLIAETAARRARGQKNLFSGHMFDGSVLPLQENLAASQELMTLCRDNEIILEVEIGVVGGEEDGVDNSGAPAEKLYTTPEDMVATWAALEPLGGRFMLAATFGNVHGVYKPGHVQLKPSILRDGQAAVAQQFGAEARFDLVFHGGSGSGLEEIHETLLYGVVKMNIDTDTQYAFTRPVVDHIMTNYAGVLKVDGEVGVKKAYDPRAYLKKGEQGMADRVARAARDLKSAGQSLDL
ncbi:MAG: class II fructose-bisphosphate aldolase [Myxococcales bacterium]|nr:class II fructose-bisphosphate aldolase [Myxococcales bacterium]